MSGWDVVGNQRKKEVVLLVKEEEKRITEDKVYERDRERPDEGVEQWV